MHDENWRPTKRGGERLPRPRGCATPCWKCPKASEGKPNPAAELTAKNWQAYAYYRQCQADTTGLLPRDLVVVKNNATIRAVEEQARREQEMMRIAGALGVGRPKGR